MDSQISLNDEYRVLNEPYIYKGNDGYKILHTSTSNYNSIQKNRDVYIYLNYTTIIRYYLFEFFQNYKGKDENITKLIGYLKDDKLNERLKIIDAIISDSYLYTSIVKKYYPEKDKFNPESKSLNLINHIFFHKDKIFTENNVIKLIRRSMKDVVVSEDNEVIAAINSGIIKGFKAEPSTIQDKNYGIDLWIFNDVGSRFSVKCVYFGENSEHNVAVLNGIVKFLMYEVKSDINNFTKGINAMRYQYIAVFNKKAKGMMFISTGCITEIVNRKLDKQVSIQFDNAIVTDKDVLKKFIKPYKFN